MDHFQLLEEKVGNLINHAASLRAEKRSLKEKVHIQEEKIAELNGEMEQLKKSRVKARNRMASLLEKIENVDI